MRVSPRFVPSRARLAAFALLAFAFSAALAGCDSNDPLPPPAPAPPANPLDARVFEVDFDLTTADFSGVLASAAFEAPELTPRAVDRGMVMAYARTRNPFDDGVDYVWRALPYTYGVEFNADTEEEPPVDYTVSLGFSYEVDFFEIFYELSADDPFVWDLLIDEGPRRIRVVVFSENALANSQSLDLRSYEAVQKHFDLNPQDTRSSSER